MAIKNYLKRFNLARIQDTALNNYRDLNVNVAEAWFKAVTEHIQIANKPAIERYINDGPGRYARCKTLLELHQLGIIDLDSKQKDVLHEIISVFNDKYVSVDE